MAKIDVVCTTISNGEFIGAWSKIMEDQDVRLIIIPDKKTPPAIFSRADQARNYGLDILCPTVDEQDDFLKKLGSPTQFIPYNTDNRRNIGFLMSWRDGANMIISVDDDNFPLGKTYFDDHQIVLAPPDMHFGVVSSTGFYNNCRMLATYPSPIWPRGFPYFARRNSVLGETWEVADVSINAGLWLGDPDVDAVTRLATYPTAKSLEGMSAVLTPGTWMPVNSQNTALRRSVIPSYYFVRMGHIIKGYPVGRMGDIFQGYFAQACAKHLGHTVRVGTPLVEQDRNDHDLLHDLEMEFPALRLLDQLLEWLVEVDLEGETYRDAYESLSYGLDDVAETFSTDSERGFLHRMSYHMRTWLDICDQIGKE